MAKGAAHRRGLVAAISVFLALGHPVAAQESPVFNTYGAPGLMDMPSARMAPDATLGLTFGRIHESNRLSLVFQITPRLLGTFRYSGIGNFDNADSVDGVFYDRSFDLRYQILSETALRPAVAIGLQDFIGTGIYSGEYIVATKSITPALTLSAGLGWGRLGSHAAITSLGTRPTATLGEGGLPTLDRWFRGDVAPFAGLNWRATERLSFTAEYSSDGYDRESQFGGFEHRSPLNLGLEYRWSDRTQISLYYAYGTTIGAQLTFAVNPKTAGTPGGNEPAPLPVSPRRPADLDALGWTEAPRTTEQAARQNIAAALEHDRIEVEGFALGPRQATLRIKNQLYGAPSQAIGRAARAMTRALPASVEQFTIVPSENGIPISAVSLRRSDLEALENDAAVEMLVRTRFDDAFRNTPPPDPSGHPRATWSLTPYLAYSAFDPDDPLRLDVGARLGGTLELAPNVSLTGSIKKRVVGNLDQIERVDESKLPRVRTDFRNYAREGDPAIETLVLNVFGRPGPNLYGRLSAGYLESMYAGLSGEVLWKPVDSRLALGAEVNVVRRRAYDTLFGLQENVTTDPVSGIEREIPDVNGHVSAYYAFGNGYHGQLDLGRYLAGDYCATLTLQREFANGWRIGAFATLTDVSGDDFGEGSFDKGLLLTVPLVVGLGSPTRKTAGIALRTVQRDGGARLDVPNRLYGTVRTWHEPDVARSWGRFWR